MSVKRGRVLALPPPEVEAAIGISAYEQSRLDNIAKNTAFLASLGIDDVRSDMRSSAEEPKSKRRATSKGVSKKAVAATEPSRRSARAAGVVVDYSAVNIDTALVEAEAPKMAERMLNDMPLHAPINATGTGGENRLVPLLNSLNKPPSNKAKAFAALSDAELLKRLSSLTVREEDVAKVVDSRIYTLCVHPSESKLLVAAGDSHGHVGIWDVDAGEVSITGGVYRYCPHVEGVMKVAVDPLSSSRIYSASYDGTIKFTDVSKEAICVSFVAPEQISELSFTDAHFAWESSSIYIGRSDGQISLKDLRSKARSYDYTASIGHENKVNSLQLSPADANILVSSSSGPDGCIIVSDVRKLGTASKGQHQLNRIKDMAKTCNGISISQDGKFLLSVGQDDTLRAYRDFTAPKGMMSHRMAHNNHTGRWLASLKPSHCPWAPHLFFVGSMLQPRRMELYSPATQGALALKLQTDVKAEWLASVCSRAAFHPTLPIIAGGNSSGRVHVAR